MAKLTEELYAALTTLNKAVFSQPAERDAPTRQTLRPILLKGERYYQLESFRDNKAFHQNFTEEQAADYARENLEGRYRQALIVTQTESRQYILRRDGSYKRTASAAAIVILSTRTARARGCFFIRSISSFFPTAKPAILKCRFWATILKTNKLNREVR